MLQLPCAILALPHVAATARDECWRDAANTLCLLSARPTQPAPGAGAAPLEEGRASGGVAGEVEAHAVMRADGGGGACAALAAPMLVDAAAAVLRGWSASSAADLGEATGAVSLRRVSHRAPLATRRLSGRRSSPQLLMTDH